MPSIEIAITLGDPAGIGPEIAAHALSKFIRQNPRAKIILFAPDYMLTRSGRFGKFSKNRSVQLHPIAVSKKFTVGQPSEESAKCALGSLDAAIQHCLSHKNVSLVTGPLDKSLCAKVLPGFSGHTEYLRDQCGVESTTMLLACRSLRVALVTTHIALKDVSDQLSVSKILAKLNHLHDFLKRSRKIPRISVSALNPHASDKGLFGDEEDRIISPAISAAKKSGISADGPFSADTIFHPNFRKNYDAILSMYHDQGLIPVKMNFFDEAVNITLGLPFLRTSPDHGPAFELASKSGRASPNSFYHALCWAHDPRAAFRRKG